MRAVELVSARGDRVAGLRLEDTRNSSASNLLEHSRLHHRTGIARVNRLDWVRPRKLVQLARDRAPDLRRGLSAIEQLYDDGILRSIRLQGASLLTTAHCVSPSGV